MSVVQHHVTDWFRAWRILPDTPATRLSHGLWFGMDLFFILSGFLIGSMILGAQREGALRFGRFYLRRAFRIFPAYYVVLSLLAFGLPALLGITLSAEQRAGLWAEYLYLTNYLPWAGRAVMPYAWSLAVEEHFYLLVPLLLAGLARVRSRALQLGSLTLLWASGFALRLAVFALHGPRTRDAMVATFYIQSHFRYDILIAGVWLAVVEHHHAAALDAAIARPAVRRGLLALSAAAFGLLFYYPLQAQHPAFNLFCWGALTSLGYVPLILVLLHARTAWVAALGWSGFRRWATLGYGIYLVHVPLIALVTVPWAGAAMLRGSLNFGGAWCLALGLGLALSTALAWVLHVAVEKPAMALRDRLTAP